MERNYHHNQELIEAKRRCDFSKQSQKCFSSKQCLMEIRTPLNGIIGMARFYLRANWANQQEVLGDIESSSHSLLGSTKWHSRSFKKLSRVTWCCRRITPTWERLFMTLWVWFCRKRWVKILNSTLILDSQTPPQLFLMSIVLGRCSPTYYRMRLSLRLKDQSPQILLIRPCR